MSATCSPFCPFARGCSFDCPAPGGDPQATLVFAGEDGFSDVTETGVHETIEACRTNGSAPASLARNEGLTTGHVSLVLAERKAPVAPYSIDPQACAVHVSRGVSDGA